MLFPGIEIPYQILLAQKVVEKMMDINPGLKEDVSSMSDNTYKKNRSLDYLAASTAQKITKIIGQENVSSNDIESFSTKTIGILQEQGIYAMFLFLLSRSGDETETKKMKPEQRVACEITAQLFELLREEELMPLGIAYGKNITFNEINRLKKSYKRDNKEITGLLSHLAKSGGLLDDLDKLLLIKDLYEQTLIYTRFGAKAAGGEE
jgi:hypothetical protein